MNKFRGGIFVGAGILSIFCIFCLLSSRHYKKARYLPNTSVQNPAPKKKVLPPQPKASRNLLNTKRAADFTDDEKTRLAKSFDEGMKPAVEKWFKAYEGRIPFRPADFTLDKFYSRIGKSSSFYVYTFVIGDATLTIQESNGKLKVNYLMSRKASQQMISMPQNGSPPDLSVPITRADVIHMVQADTGVQFTPSEVTISPTGAACALMGGAYAYVIPAGADPNNALSRKVDMVFGSDGKLVYYMRDPFF